MASTYAFALFLEAYMPDASEPDGWSSRCQTLVMPGGERNGVHALQVFHRKQQRPGHRAVWRTTLTRDPESAAAVVRDRANYDQFGLEVGYTLRTPFVVQVRPAETQAAWTTGATPYKVLERCRRVAGRHHGFVL